MAAFIVQYWLEFVFGLIAAGAGIVAKKCYNLYKSEKAHQEENRAEGFKKVIHTEVFDEIQKSRTLSDERYNKTKKNIDRLEVELDVLREGILSIQGRNFKEDCYKLLAEDHVITQTEWELIDVEHNVYNSLGGNHEGDRLYTDVETKYRNNL